MIYIQKHLQRTSLFDIQYILYCVAEELETYKTDRIPTYFQ